RDTRLPPGAAVSLRSPTQTPRGTEDFRSDNESSSQLREVGVVDVQTNVLQGGEVDVSIDLLVLLVEHELPARVDEGPIPQTFAAIDLRRERPRPVEERVEHGRADREAVVDVPSGHRADDAGTPLRQIDATERVTHPLAEDLRLHEPDLVVARERRQILDVRGERHHEVSAIVEE